MTSGHFSFLGNFPLSNFNRMYRYFLGFGGRTPSKGYKVAVKVEKDPSP